MKLEDKQEIDIFRGRKVMQLEYIKTEEINKQTLAAICSVGLDCIQEYFLSEENQKAFEQWKQKRETAMHEKDIDRTDEGGQ